MSAFGGKANIDRSAATSVTGIVSLTSAAMWPLAARAGDAFHGPIALNDVRFRGKADIERSCLNVRVWPILDSAGGLSQTISKTF